MMVQGKFERRVISDIVSNVVQPVRGVTSVSTAPQADMGVEAGDQTRS